MTDKYMNNYLSKFLGYKLKYDTSLGTICRKESECGVFVSTLDQPLDFANDLSAMTRVWDVLKIDSFTHMRDKEFGHSFTVSVSTLTGAKYGDTLERAAALATIDLIKQMKDEV